MNISAIVKKAQKTAADNTPTILTALGVTGLVTTAVLTGKASFKAAEVLAEHKDGRSEQEKLDDVKWYSIDQKQKLDLIWKLYIPAVGTGAVTIACIVSANHISTRRTAALASAYSIAQEGFREYREKVVDKIGEVKEQKVRDEIAKDKLEKNPPPTAEILVLAGNNVVCGDSYSGRYFISNTNKIEKAVNDTNHDILKNDYATLTELWSKLGLDSTSESDEVGWTTDELIEVKYSWGPTDDDRPCMFVDFGRTTPIRGLYSPFR